MKAYDDVLERLDKSLNEGVLLGNFNEPLDAYGKRLVRVILAEFDRERAKVQHHDKKEAK